MAFAKKLTAWVLAAVLTAQLLPTLALPALAVGSGESGSINENISDSALKTLGFDTGTDDIEKVIQSGYTPLGDKTASVLPVSELALHGRSNFRYYESAAVSSGALTAGAGVHQTSDSDRARSVAFNPKGSAKGRDDYVAEVSSKRKDGATAFYLTVYDAAGRERRSLYLGDIELQFEAPQGGAWLAIAAGDYDGDGYDELAVYNPATVRHDGAHSPSVELFEYRVSGNSLESRAVEYIGGAYAHGDQITVRKTEPCLAPSLYFLTSARYTGEGDNKGPRDHVNHFPSVSLSTVEGTMDGIDDLAVAVSVSRSADDRDYAGDYGYKEELLNGRK